MEHTSIISADIEKPSLKGKNFSSWLNFHVLLKSGVTKARRCYTSAPGHRAGSSQGQCFLLLLVFTIRDHPHPHPHSYPRTERLSPGQPWAPQTFTLPSPQSPAGSQGSVPTHRYLEALHPWFQEARAKVSSALPLQFIAEKSLLSQRKPSKYELQLSLQMCVTNASAFLNSDTPCLIQRVCFFTKRKRG